MNLVNAEKSFYEKQAVKFQSGFGCGMMYYRIHGVLTIMDKMFIPFRENIQTHKLIEPGQTVIAGFSGGKDSVAMLLLLLELQTHMPFKLLAAYFNHRLRDDARAEENWVKKFARQHHIELVVGSRDVRRFRQEQGLNLEHAASLSRYDFFYSLADRWANARIATAHTRSDLAETFLIKLLRGSGLQGLSALYQSKKRIIRPLLVFDEEEILAFVQRRGEGFYQDPSNLQADFLRNRIRQQLLPAFKKIEPDIERRIFKTVMLLQEEFDYFQTRALQKLPHLLIRERILPLASWQSLHLALQRHLLREYIRLLKGNLLNIGFEHIDDILSQTGNNTGLSVPGLHLRMEKGFLFPADVAVPDYLYRIPREGDYFIAEIEREIRIEKIESFRQPPNNREILVPAAKLVFPLLIRPAQRQDAYQKIHSPYRQKVFEMIRVAGFPAPLRNLCPLLVNGDGALIWSCGAPLADSFRTDDEKAGPFYRISFSGPSPVVP